MSVCKSCWDQLFKQEWETLRKPKFEEATWITDKIFLGGENSTLDLEYLKSNEITSIL